MCLILFAHDVHPRYRLVLAANRDEFYARPTTPAHRWADAPQVLAGRDLQGGGTWLGVTTTGRWGAVTNVREPGRHREHTPSRGELVHGYLAGRASPEAYLRALRSRAAAYNGYNLIVGDPASLWACSNRGTPPRALEPGVYGVSNHLLDTPWPKVQHGKQQLLAALDGPDDALPDALFALLADRTPAPESALPETGVGRAWERVLSSAFIASPGYGTRSSTVLLIDRQGEATLLERSFAPGGARGPDAPEVHEVRHVLSTPLAPRGQP